MHIMEIPEREKRDKGTEEILEAMTTQNFPKLMSNTKPHIQESQGTSEVGYVPKKIILRCVIFKSQKIKKFKETCTRSIREKLQNSDE